MAAKVGSFFATPFAVPETSSWAALMNNSGPSDLLYDMRPKVTAPPLNSSQLESLAKQEAAGIVKASRGAVPFDQALERARKDVKSVNDLNAADGPTTGDYVALVLGAAGIVTLALLLRRR